MRGHDTSRMLVAIGQSYVSSVQSVCVFQYRPAGCFLCLGRMDIHGFKVVPATPSDVSLIANFITAFADEHRMNAAVRINEGRLTKCLFGTERTAEAFIGYQHDDPVSYALFFTDFSSFTGETGLYLEDLYVRPEARGSGIGGQMLRHLAKLALARGHRRIRWCSLKNNYAAKQFYLRQGANRLDDFLLFQLAGKRLEALACQWAESHQ